MLGASIGVWAVREEGQEGEIAQLKKRNKELCERIEVLEKDSGALHLENKEIAAVHARVMTVCIAAQARHNRTLAAMSRIFAEEKEARDDSGVSETERAVIDHCLRQLTDEERAKFLCECGSLDGGFVFRNQVRREMDAIIRDPERLAEMMADQVPNNAEKVKNTTEEGPSQEVQNRKKRKGKKKRKH